MNHSAVILKKKVKNEICLDETRLRIVQGEEAKAVTAIPTGMHPSRHQPMKVLRIQLPGLLLNHRISVHFVSAVDPYLRPLALS